MHEKDPDTLLSKNPEGRCSVVIDVTPVISSIVTYNWGLSLNQILQLWEENKSWKNRTTVMNLNLPEKGSFSKYFVSNKLYF